MVEVEALPSKRVYPGAPPRPDGIYDLYVDGALTDQGTIPGSNVITIDMSTWSSSTERGEPGRVRFDDLPAHDKLVEIWLPHNEATELIAVHTDQAVVPVTDRGQARWLHHGSSISHGSDAASPSQTWVASAARAGAVDLTNLGFGGSALLDPLVARTIRDTEADLISLKLGINLVNTDVMRMRAFTPAVHGFLDTIRDGHPTTPLLVISPIYCRIHEETPGPAGPDMSAIAGGRMSFVATGNPEQVARGALTLQTIRAELARIVEQRRAIDPYLYYLDGRDLYDDAAYAEMPLPDELHPSPPAHEHMGQRFAAWAFGGDAAWGAAASGRNVS